jgi:hypothetical protein
MTTVAAPARLVIRGVDTASTCTSPPHSIRSARRSAPRSSARRPPASPTARLAAQLRRRRPGRCRGNRQLRRCAGPAPDDQRRRGHRVSRPNRQVRRRHGKTDTVDAIAAARDVMSGEASATPKTHKGSVEGLRALKLLQRSANKSRTQAINQLRSLLLTAPPELRAKLQRLPMRELLATCAAFPIAAKSAVGRAGLPQRCRNELVVQRRQTGSRWLIERPQHDHVPPERKPKGARRWSVVDRPGLL